MSKERKINGFEHCSHKTLHCVPFYPYPGLTPIRQEAIMG